MPSTADDELDTVTNDGSAELGGEIAAKPAPNGPLDAVPDSELDETLARR